MVGLSSRYHKGGSRNRKLGNGSRVGIMHGTCLVRGVLRESLNCVILGSQVAASAAFNTVQYSEEEGFVGRAFSDPR